MTRESTEVYVERDRNVLTGEDMARIRFRRPADRHWRSVLVVLDEDTTFETVEENAILIVANYKAAPTWRVEYLLGEPPVSVAPGADQQETT